MRIITVVSLLFISLYSVGCGPDKNPNDSGQNAFSGDEDNRPDYFTRRPLYDNQPDRKRHFEDDR